MTRVLPHGRAAPLGVSRVALALLALTGCGPVTGEIVAEDDAVEVPTGPRGRVRVIDGKLETDVGSALRGLLVPVDVGWTLDDIDLFERVSRETGLNAVHVYLENWNVPVGSKLADANALVALTEKAGLYLVLGLGGGPTGVDHPGNGWFDPALVRDFWSFYAPRYGHKTHVVYELINNPELGCDAPFAEATLDMERDTYALVRSLAPETHVLMFSTSAVLEPAMVADAVSRVPTVDFSNASLAMHAESDCVGPERFGEVDAALTATATPAIMSQLAFPDWSPYVAELETRRIGWMHHEWLASSMSDVDGLIQATSDAGLTWCPDQGTFPEDSATCRRR